MKSNKLEEREYSEAIRCLSLTVDDLFQEIDRFLRPKTTLDFIYNIYYMLRFLLTNEGKNFSHYDGIMSRRTLYFLLQFQKKICKQGGLRQEINKKIRDLNDVESVLAITRYLIDTRPFFGDIRVPSTRLATVVVKLGVNQFCPEDR